MTKKLVMLSMAALLGVVASSSNAAVITVSQVLGGGGAGAPSRQVSATESGGGAPVDGDIYQFRVTTDADILSVFSVKVTLASNAALYNHPNGNASNAEPGDPAFIAFLPALGADSWITTPGGTSRLGPDLPGDGVDTTFGDTTDDGAQANFLFAQLTVPKGSTGTFTGSIAIKNTPDPFNQTFSFNLGVPEPASFGLASMALVGLAGLRRRKA